MLRWPTIHEMITGKIEKKSEEKVVAQFPVFMRRKVLLFESYDKKKDDFRVLTSKRIRKKTVSDGNPSQVLFNAYKRANEQVKSVFDKRPVQKDEENYDEALEKQEMFVKDVETKDGNFKYSSCPRGNTANVGIRKRIYSKIKSFAKIPHKITAKVDEKLLNLATSNVLALISRSSNYKCPNCGDSYCGCLSFDEVMPENCLENIKKGKILLEKAKSAMKNRKKVVVSKPEALIINKRALLDEEIMRYTAKIFIKKDLNLVEGSSVQLHLKYRRHSS